MPLEDEKASAPGQTSCCSYHIVIHQGTASAVNRRPKGCSQLDHARAVPQVGKLAVQKFLFTGLVAAVALPLALLSAASLLDNPWAVATERAMKVTMNSVHFSMAGRCVLSAANDAHAQRCGTGGSDARHCLGQCFHVCTAQAGSPRRAHRLSLSSGCCC